MAIKPARQPVNKLDQATARQFDGGLNVVDSQLNLNSKYAVVLDNMYRGLDGSITVRQGTQLFADLQSISTNKSPLLNGVYFRNFIVTVNKLGEVFKTDGTGTSWRIWDAAIAASHYPPRVMWGPTNTDLVTFCEIGGQVVIQNGVDKPLVVYVKDGNLTVDYHADPATGSNLNVPIGTVMCNYAKHLVIATGSILNVSDENAPGTFAGDSGATYAAQFDLKNSVTVGDTTIIGLSDYRDWLLVHFKECTVPVQFSKITTPSAALAIADGSDTGGTLKNYGAISPRTVQDLGDVTLVADIAGVASVNLAQYTLRLSPDRPSRLIDPLIKRAFAPLSPRDLNNGVFAIYDRLESMYMLMVPNADVNNQLNTDGFGYRYLPTLNIRAWNTFSGWNWHWGCRSSEGLIFFGREGDCSIFVYGNSEKLPLHADYIGDQETFSDGTVFSDDTGLSPVASFADSGIPINFAWNLPWSDMKKRGLTKSLRYIAFDAEGSGQFTVKVFIDEKYRLNRDPGEPFSDGLTFSDGTGFDRDLTDPQLTPALSLDFVGADHGGFGSEEYNDDFGGGRNTSFRRLVYAPTKFNTFKLRFEGATMKPLKIVGITLYFMRGTIRANTDV